MGHLQTSGVRRQGDVGPVGRSRSGPRQRSLLTTACEQVSVLWVCAQLGVPMPDDAALMRSVKLLCPFGAFWHSDGGREAALRVYPDVNNATCFAEKQFYTPVTLYARAKGVEDREAAALLLELVGYRGLTVGQEWDRVVATEVPVSKDSLSEALKQYCVRSFPGWEELQFRPDVAHGLARCLALTPRVHTGIEARQWLSVSKQVLGRILER